MADARRLAVSNIAWEPAEDDAIAAVLQRERVQGIELAPTKWRERPFDAGAEEVAAYRSSWEQRGMQVVSLQALLFGRPDLQLFGDGESRARLAEYLRRAVDFAAAVGAHALVFGSPKNRVRGELAMPDAMNAAAEFFRALAPHAAERGTALCIEANPTDYGCDFVTTTAEAATLCRLVDHPGVRVNVDLGGMVMSRENVGDAIRGAAGLIGHVHASEPNLGAVAAQPYHTEAGAVLSEIGYRGWVSIEMRAAGDNVAAVERAIREVRLAYQLDEPLR